MPQVNVIVEGLLVDFSLAGPAGDRRNRQLQAFTAIARPSSATTNGPSSFQAAGYTVHCATYKMLERNPGPFLGLVRQSLGI